MTEATVILARSGEGLKSGPWGLAIVLLLCVAVYFLWRSMNKHLKNVRAQAEAAAYDLPHATAGAAPDGPATDVPGAPGAHQPAPPAS